MKPAIEVQNISKVYNISHRQEAEYITLRDSIVGLAKKPLELLTGQKVDKEKFWALSDINFTVQPGEVVGIIGKNGSGKSTLLKILSRIVEPTSGKAIMRGKVASLLEVGTGFHPELTGRENIYFNGAILGMGKKEIERKFDEIVAFSEVEQFLDTPVKFYSSGMYVRLAFAVAAHLEPDILIVDEVLAVGDSAFQKKSLGKMKDVAGQGRTVLFVSHSMGSIKQLCTKGILLSKGKIVDTGSVEKVISRYADASQEDFEDAVIATKTGVVERVIVDNDSAANHHIVSGDPVKVVLAYTPKQPQKKVVFGLAVRSVQEASLVVYTHSDLENTSFSVDGRQEFEFNLQLPRMAPGEYVLELNLWADGVFSLDSQPVAKLLVDPLAPFPSGEVFASFPSLILTESAWKKKD
jgi:lipopolysaccharide transport system ATP-binding protein